MAGKSTELIAEETRELRFKIHRLMAEGLDEGKALLEALPKDGNRRRKLNRWRERGLWPIPAGELAKYGKAVEGETEPDTSQLVGATSSEDQDLGEPSSQLPEHPSAGDEKQSEAALEPTPPTVEISQNKGTRTTQPTSPLLAPPLENSEEVNAMMKQLLTLYRSGRLAELAQSEALEPPTATLPHMPKLTMKPSSVYLSVKLMEMAEAKAQADPVLPAGQTWTRSSLVSYLVWQYLGFPSVEEIEGSSEE